METAGRAGVRDLLGPVQPVEPSPRLPAVEPALRHSAPGRPPGQAVPGIVPALIYFCHIQPQSNSLEKRSGSSPARPAACLGWSAGLGAGQGAVRAPHAIAARAARARANAKHAAGSSRASRASPAGTRPECLQKDAAEPGLLGPRRDAAPSVQLDRPARLGVALLAAGRVGTVGL